ncbi:MAG: hypothetical protein GWN58_63245, partial [Anaerolineae bacterium]|nr:hypothetical protein [Anaerolineae bacterium]
QTLSIAYHSEAEWNETDFRSEELDELIERARGEEDETARQELYAAAQELLRNEGGALIPYFKPMVMAKRKEVQNFQPHPASWINVRDTWVARQA